LVIGIGITLLLVVLSVNDKDGIVTTAGNAMLPTIGKSNLLIFNIFFYSPSL
jgi:hypothetical protein